MTCFSGEPDLERVMSHSQREEVLKWAWLTWRQATGPSIKHLYSKMVSISNEAARKKGILFLSNQKIKLFKWKSLQVIRI